MNENKENFIKNNKHYSRKKKWKKKEEKEEIYQLLKRLP